MHAQTSSNPLKTQTQSNMNLPHVNQIPTFTPNIKNQIPSFTHNIQNQNPSHAFGTNLNSFTPNIGLQNVNSSIGHPYHNAVASAMDTSFTQVDVFTNQMLALQRQVDNMQISMKKT